MIELASEIRQNLESVQNRIARAAQSVHRKPEEVRLVVVTKSQPIEVAAAAIEAGASILGENYADEGARKIEQLGKQPGLEWHMIGHIQSRKSRLVCQYFDAVHSLDSLYLAQRLDACAAETPRVIPALLEFNLGGEESKSGWLAAEKDQWGKLIPEIEAIIQLDGLRLIGLMSMPPLEEDPSASRPYFVKLRSLQDFLATRFPQVQWKELSMGTSADYEIAVEEGATMVRVGRAILGPRPAKQ